MACFQAEKCSDSNNDEQIITLAFIKTHRLRPWQKNNLLANAENIREAMCHTEC